MTLLYGVSKLVSLFVSYSFIHFSGSQSFSSWLDNISHILPGHMKLADASLCVIKQKPRRHEESCYIELSRVIANSVHYRPWHNTFYAVILTPLLYPWERDVGAN